MKVAEIGFRRDIVLQIWICDEALIEVLTVYPRAKRVQMRSRRVFVQVTPHLEAARPAHEGLSLEETDFVKRLTSGFKMLRRVQQFQLDSRQTLSIIVRTHDKKGSLLLLLDIMQPPIERAFGKILSWMSYHSYCPCFGQTMQISGSATVTSELANLTASCRLQAAVCKLPFRLMKSNSLYTMVKTSLREMSYWL